MKDILRSVEGQMDESYFYLSLVWAIIRGTGLIVVAIFAGYIVYDLLIPAATGGNAGLYLLSWAITTLAFMYVFNPSKWIGWGGRIMLVVYSAGYSFMMHIGGEIVFIAMLMLGIIVATFLVFGDATCSGIFMYNDLKEWVKNKQFQEEQKRKSETATKGDFSS